MAQINREMPSSSADKVMAMDARGVSEFFATKGVTSKLTWNQREVLKKLDRGEQPSRLYTRAINSLKKRGLVYYDAKFNLRRGCGCASCTAARELGKPELHARPIPPPRKRISDDRTEKVNPGCCAQPAGIRSLSSSDGSAKP